MSKPDVDIALQYYDCVEIVAYRGQRDVVGAALGGRAMPVAPDRWIVAEALRGLGELADELSAALGNAAAVIDQSSFFAVHRISGPRGREALAKLCRLDLHPSVFPVGKAARTLMAQIAVIIHLADDAPSFDLFVPATLSQSFAHHLDQASAEFRPALRPEERPTR